jgi:hypothetical protein
VVPRDIHDGYHGSGFSVVASASAEGGTVANNLNCPFLIVRPRFIQIQGVVPFLEILFMSYSKFTVL